MIAGAVGTSAGGGAVGTSAGQGAVVIAIAPGIVAPLPSRLPLVPQPLATAIVIFGISHAKPHG